MNFTNLVYMALEKIEFCSNNGDAAMIWTIFGYVILGIEIVVPLLLIITGMITMAQAVMKKDEKEIKGAQKILIQKVIAAVICFLVIALTKIVVGLVADDNWQSCAECAFHPLSDNCGIIKGSTSGTN